MIMPVYNAARIMATAGERMQPYDAR